MRSFSCIWLATKIPQEQCSFNVLVANHVFRHVMCRCPFDKTVFLSLQTDEEWEEDELGKGEQGVSVSQILGESGYKGW